jgi:hypothetical protein
MTDDQEEDTKALSIRKRTDLMRNPHVSRGLKDVLLPDKQWAQAEIARLSRELELLEDPETIFSFGQMSFEGDGVEQNYVEAAAWFRIAADQGHVGAQHNLALMYENGEGVPQDYSEAAKWYRMAAEQGNAGSQNNLGGLYESGLGVATDYAVAIEWYRKGADGGDEVAHSNLQRLTNRTELEDYREIVSGFSEIMARHSPLIGDCSLLPYPKERILYALKFVVDEYETKRALETDPKLVEMYDRMIPTLNYLFTRLVDDWQDISPEDKDAIAKLSEYDSFPEWALPLRDKYIDEERARRDALEVTFRVMKDKVAREREMRNEMSDDGEDV